MSIIINQVFDEDSQEYKPRFGYKRIKNGLEDTPIVEVKKGQDPFADPWAEETKSKKDNIKKNLKNQQRNQGRADAAMGKPRQPAPGKKYGKTIKLRVPSPSCTITHNEHLKPIITIRLTYFHYYDTYPTDATTTPGIPLDLDTNSGAGKQQRGKQGVRRALQLVQHSTASMGRFDEMRQGEPKRKIQGKKRSFRDNMTSADADKDTMKAQLRIVTDKVDKKARGVTNSLKAYEGIIPDAPSDTFQQKKGKGKSAQPKKGESGGAGKDRSKGKTKGSGKGGGHGRKNK